MNLDGLWLDRAGQPQPNTVKDLPTLSRQQMLRIAERLPQAMLKVTSYQHGLSRVAAAAKYLCRDGELPMESGEGEVLLSMDEVQEMLHEWQYDFGERRRSRDSVHIVLSTPRGSDRRATHRAIREFAAEVFGRNHSYLFAIHNDTPYPHGHLLIKLRGHDGTKLNPRKHDLLVWRERFAEKSREQGIAVDASPRLARGVGTKGRRQSVRRLSERAGESRVKEGFIEAVRSAFGELNELGGITLRTWEASAKRLTEHYRQLYRQEAKAMQAESERLPKDTGELLQHQAEQLLQFAEALSQPKSQREQAVETIVLKQRERQIER